MTDEDIAMVRESFAHLHRHRDATTKLFYDRLFEIAPDVRRLFKDELTAQRHKLIEFLAVAMATLRDPAGLSLLLRKLGRMHSGLGVEERHFDDLRGALFWTLKTSLGTAFTPSLDRAWASLYEIMSREMIAALRAP